MREREKERDKRESGCGWKRGDCVCKRIEREWVCV